MGISQLQKDAFSRSQNFLDQTNGLVKNYALYLDNQNPDLIAADVNTLRNVVTAPAGYRFPETIISDPTWAITYDAWAADPSSHDVTIQGFIQAAWKLLVGQIPTPPPPPEPPI